MTSEELLNQLDSTNPLYKGANYEAIRDYIMSLKKCVEKQIPVRVTAKLRANIYYGEVYIRTCPECGDEVVITKEAMHFEHYCRKCGKALDFDWRNSK